MKFHCRRRRGGFTRTEELAWAISLRHLNQSVQLFKRFGVLWPDWRVIVRTGCRSRYALEHAQDGSGAGRERSQRLAAHWRANGLKPHLVHGFKVSADPLFVEKLEDIVGLYMSPPEHAECPPQDRSRDAQGQDPASDRRQLRHAQAPRRAGLAGHIHLDQERARHSAKSRSREQSLKFQTERNTRRAPPSAECHGQPPEKGRWPERRNGRRTQCAARKSCTAAIVAAGASSISQWPAFGTTSSCTFVAALRMTTATLAPKAFSAPMASTGIASFVSIALRLSASSFWSIARNWANAECIAPGLA